MPNCPQCGREVPEQLAGRPCPVCVQQAHDAARKQQFRDYALHTLKSATGVLIVLNVLVYVAMVLRGVSPTEPTVEQLWRWGANFGPFTFDHQSWRLLTCIFLHVGIVHLLLNMWALLNVGPLAEAVYGRWNYVSMYLICGLSSSIASLLWSPTVTSAGASGAIFGIMGALIATLYFDKVRIPRHVSRPILSSLVISAVAMLAYGSVKTGIDNGAHIGGLVSGLVLGTLVGRRLDRTADARRFHQIVFVASAIVLIGAGMLVWRRNHCVVLLDKAEDAITAGKPETALPFLNEATREKPQNPEVHLLRGDVLLRLAQGAQAEQEYRQVIALRPNDARAWNALGRSLVRQNKLDDATEAFTKATQLQPDDATNWYDLGLLMQKQNRLQEALAALDHATQLRASVPEYWFTFGLTAMGAKDYDTAIRSFQQLAKLVPKSPEPLVWLANAYSAKGMQAEAQTAFAQAQELARSKSAQQK